MNILLWVLQIALALYYLMGGIWIVSKIPAVWLKLLPKPAWMALGLLQILFALGLVLPGVIGMSPKLTSIAAVGVIIETVFVAVLTKPKFQGALWVIVPALLALVVAYGRVVLQPV
jgi:hypothetical protein